MRENERIMTVGLVMESRGMMWEEEYDWSERLEGRRNEKGVALLFEFL